MTKSDIPALLDGSQEYLFEKALIESLEWLGKADGNRIVGLSSFFDEVSVFSVRVKMHLYGSTSTLTVRV